MIYLYACLLVIVSIAAGLYLGAWLYRPKVVGAIVVSEGPDKMVFRIDLAGDPEFLVFEKAVTFLVIPPDYSKLTSQ